MDCQGSRQAAIHVFDAITGSRYYGITSFGYRYGVLVGFGCTAGVSVEIFAGSGAHLLAFAVVEWRLLTEGDSFRSEQKTPPARARVCVCVFFPLGSRYGGPRGHGGGSAGRLPSL